MLWFDPRAIGFVTRIATIRVVWMVPFFIALGLFVVTGVLLARSQTRYLRLYRELHGSEPLLWADSQPWQWRRDGRVTSSLLHVLLTPQDKPELERRRLNARLWQFATLAPLVVTFALGLASQRF